MNKYRKVIKPREAVVKDDGEIRVTAGGSVSAYVSRAAKLLNEMEKQHFTITATGNALTKAVTAAEVIKRRFKGLHQITTLSSQEIVDEYEPLEEGLDKVTDTRNVPVMEIKLSKEALDKTDKGYQEPIDESLVTEVDPEAIMKGRGRGRGGGKGRGKGKGKSKSRSRGGSSPTGKGKGAGKSPSKGKGKGKSKGKGKDSSPAKGGKGKGREASFGGRTKSAPPKGKGKGKGKGSKGGYDEYPSKGGKSKGKYSGYASPYDGGKGGKKGSMSWDWHNSYDTGKSKGKGQEKGKGKGKGKKGGGWY